MNSSLDSDGWYRRVPVKTLDEWKEVQKICGSAYDQAFSRPVMNRIKPKIKAKYNIHAHRLPGFTDDDRQTNSINRSHQQKTGRRATEAKPSMEK